MSEQRAIDAYGVQRLLNMSYHGCGLDSFSLGFREALGLAIQTIENEPTIDPVQHGKWIKPTKIAGRSFDIPHCSVCEGVPCGVDENTNYCTNCGARMDKE